MLDGNRLDSPVIVEEGEHDREAEKLRGSGQYTGRTLAWAGGAAAAGGDEVDPDVLRRCTSRVQGQGRRHVASSRSLRRRSAAPTNSRPEHPRAGLLKLVRPKPVIERSHFRVEDGRIRPMEFWYEDGSRKGEDNRHIEFDWHRTSRSSAGRRPPRSCPRRSLARSRQHASRVDARHDATGSSPATTGSRTKAPRKGYAYHGQRRNDDDDRRRPLGRTHSVACIARAHRERRFWFAPELHYLAGTHRAEQEGEVQTAFSLTSQTGLGKK